MVIVIVKKYTTLLY